MQNIQLYELFQIGSNVCTVLACNFVIYNNGSLFQILKVPKDQGDTAYRMLDRILNDLDKWGGGQRQLQWAHNRDEVISEAKLITY